MSIKGNMSEMRNVKGLAYIKQEQTKTNKEQITRNIHNCNTNESVSVSIDFGVLNVRV